jgi:phenylacetate-coenzyme A ligase PaaK-like adenylate-forming protein
MEKNLYRGEWIDASELSAKMDNLNEIVSADLSTKMDLDRLLYSCQQLSLALKDNKFPELEQSLLENNISKIDADKTLLLIADFLSRDYLEQKIINEFGTLFPFDVNRSDMRKDIFEGFAPLGVLLHIVPANAPTVAPLSMIEGLLSGNINVLKNTARNGNFAQLLLKRLIDLSPDNFLASFIYAFEVSSKDEEIMSKLYANADAIAAWGGEESVKSIKEVASSNTKIIDWGHRISFSYVTNAMKHSDADLEQIAHDICIVNQQACSSPQCLYLETEDFAELKDFAKYFAPILDKVSKLYPFPEVSQNEWGEITTVTSLSKTGAALDESDAIVSIDMDWRILIDSRSSLMPSPLYRTIWVKPLPKNKIVATLHPLRAYLQSVGLVCTGKELPFLSKDLVQAGCNRICRPGHMLDSYAGEPHDGVYALRRYTRKVSAHVGAIASGIATFADFEEKFLDIDRDAPVLAKKGFVKHEVDPEYKELFFRSGGSSGKPKLSYYSYLDYSMQMYAAAEGLYAAGLDPKTDIAMNLFYAGSMYGSFLSFWSILEHMKCKQLPMTAIDDFDFDMEVIRNEGVNTLFSLPSYIFQLFDAKKKELKEYGGIKKIFCGGEPISDSITKHFKEEFGVEIMKSVIYGSNDGGPIGYSCPDCEPGTFHLMESIQEMEIFDLDKDEPAKENSAGRILLTPRHRHGQKLVRYEIGDLGMWVDDCSCGRKSKKFKLMGKYGDVFKMGPNFNYNQFTKVLSEDLNYSFELQLKLSMQGTKHHLLFLMDKESGLSEDDVKKAIYKEIPELADFINVYKFGKLECQFIDNDGFERIESSGKLRRIIDER